MASVTILAHAKLNLALEVLRRRPDGFHELRTLFERIDLADRLTFKPARAGEIRITCDHPGVPCDERNLVYRVARLLIEQEGVKRGVCVHIEKRIPVAAGLAGGSSDAAAALVGLNRLWRLRLGQDRLVDYAGRVGSDVAFFLYDTSFALGQGRGEKIRPLQIPHRFWHVLITPKAPLLTKDVYRICAQQLSGKESSARKGGRVQLTKPGDNVTMLARSLRKQDVVSARKLLFNDLEKAIAVLRPGLLTLKARLQKHAPDGVCFSGSGPSIFVLTSSQREAQAIASHFDRTYTQVFVTQTA